ncbi:MAG: endonuclease/exonuclease/phosphatase family protein [Candidatus Aminicenantaceae bacterium]
MSTQKNLRFLTFILCCVVIFSTFHCGGKKSDTQLKAMSFNIRYDNPDDGENAWPHRKEMVAQTIMFHGVDFLGIQEALDTQVQDLANLLPEYAWIGFGRDDGQKRGEYAPIFFLRERFRLFEKGCFWLSETPEVPGSMGWDAACPRIVTWGKFQDTKNRCEFYFVNTHFDHVGSTAREKSAELLLKRLDEKVRDKPLIITGDFNCTQEESPYVILTQGLEGIPGVKDAQYLSENGHYGGTQTFNGFKDTLRPGLKIDFIFVRNIDRVINHGIIADRWDGRFASDHYPIHAEVTFHY